MYRVWTKNAFSPSPTFVTDWQTRSACKRMILGRFGHWPAFAFISKAKSTESFKRYNGE